MTVDLEQALLDGGARFVNFFEGRILTGRDLRDEQTAARGAREALGRAIGAGVAHGLEVTDVTPAEAGATPRLRVSAGLALNREGQTLSLAAARTLRLATLAPDDPERSRGIFEACDDQPATSAAPTAEGFHLLTLAPASGYEEQAPASGLGEQGVGASCGRRYATLGLRFRLVPFDPAALAGGEAGAEISELDKTSGDAALSRLRNAVAHLGLGGARRAGFALDPFATGSDGASAHAGAGLEAALSAGEAPPLTRCEVPLAALRLRGGRLSFVDMWTVRRRPAPPPQEAAFPPIASAAEAARQEATLFQFQRQLDWIAARLGGPSAVRAGTHFRHLPPVGLLRPGMAESFLKEAPDPIEIAPSRVLPLIREALPYGPVDLEGDAAPAFRLYRPRGGEWTLFVTAEAPSPEAMAAEIEALRALAAALGEATEAPGYLVGRVAFAKPALAFRGVTAEPLPGVIVRATPRGDHGDGPVEATTDKNGRYRLSLAPGRWDATVVYEDAPLTRVAQRDLEVVRGRETTADFALSVKSFGDAP